MMNSKNTEAQQLLTISSDLLHILFQYASQLGLTEESLQSNCRFDLAEYQSSESRIPLLKFNEIWSFLRNQSQNPNFGLQFGLYAHQMLKRHLLYALMMNCKTVEQAIKKNFLYHNLITDVIKPVILLDSSMAILKWEMNHDGIRQERQFTEAILALFASKLGYITENQVQLSEVRFSHPMPDSIDEHGKIFNAPLLFDQPVNEILLFRRHLKKNILLANPQLLEDLETLVQKSLHRNYQVNSWAEKVSTLFTREMMNGEDINIQTISKKLGLTDRSLQLKLQEEGTTYRELVDNIRKETACEYLKDPQASICEIALLLGFSDQSSFHHAFRRWTGKNPGTYRKNLGL